MTRFDTIFHRHYPQALHLAHKLTGSREAAEDIIMRVFASLWQQLDNIGEQSVKAWLMISVKNKCLTYLHHRTITIKRDRDYGRDMPWSEQPSLKQEVIYSLHHEINQLPPQRRKIMILKLEGYTSTQIAKALSLSPQTVKNQVSNAFKTIKCRLII